MQCFHPIPAFQLESGAIVFVERGKVLRAFQVRCGRCIGCRLDRSQGWAQRCMHESQLHKESWFVTLTYSEENVPRELVYRHFQLFMKRLRRAKGAVRFFMCGEYGERTARPHFHACLFGLSLDDLVLYKRLDSGFVLYTSKFLESVWQKGFCVVGAVSMDSAAYVARYCVKKVVGKDAEAHYTRVDDVTGEIYSITPEFAHMSLKPGIGARWIEKYKEEVYGSGRAEVRDSVVVNGSYQRPAKFYDRFLKSKFVEEYEALQFKREKESYEFSDDSTPERLAVREVVAKSRLSFKKRNVE